MAIAILTLFFLVALSWKEGRKEGKEGCLPDMYTFVLCSFAVSFLDRQTSGIVFFGSLYLSNVPLKKNTWWIRYLNEANTQQSVGRWCGVCYMHSRMPSLHAVQQYRRKRPTPFRQIRNLVRLRGHQRSLWNNDDLSTKQKKLKRSVCTIQYHRHSSETRRLPTSQESLAWRRISPNATCTLHRSPKKAGEAGFIHSPCTKI